MNTQNTQITQFSFETSEVRVVMVEDQPWFVLRDVLQAMGSKTTSNNAKASIIECLGDGHVETAPFIDSLGRTQEPTIISETALTFLALRSQRLKGSNVISAILSQISDSKAIIKALNDFEVPDDLPEMYVYAIREAESKRIKLGISRDPQARLRQLQTGNSQKLELVAFKPAVNRFAEERALQADNAASRIRGEWFDGRVVASFVA